MVNLIKQVTPAIANSAAFGKFVSLLEQTDGERTNLFRVLTYHRVDEPETNPWLDPVLLSASPGAFAAQMKYLADNYTVISVQDLIEALESEGRITLPPRTVLITFDDAYTDFETHAWPTLKQYRLPVTLFVPTAFPDNPDSLFWWDRVYHAISSTEKEEVNSPIGRLPITTTLQRRQAYKRLKNHIKTLPNDEALEEVERLCAELGVLPYRNCVLGWDALRKLASEGVTLGAHTQTHPIMNFISLDKLRAETVGSKEDLFRETGVVPQVFAYPSGIHNKDAVEALSQAGFALAFTTERGINQVGRADRLRLRRINVGMRTTLPLLRAQLSSWTANFNILKTER